MRDLNGNPMTTFLPCSPGTKSKLIHGCGNRNVQDLQKILTRDGNGNRLEKSVVWKLDGQWLSFKRFTCTKLTSRHKCVSGSR